jgi:serine protease Do
MLAFDVVLIRCVENIAVKRKKNCFTIDWVAFFIFLGVLGSVAFSDQQASAFGRKTLQDDMAIHSDNGANEAKLKHARESTESGQSANQVSLDVREGFADLIEQFTPAVVNISTTKKQEISKQAYPHFQVPPGSPFEDFLHEFFGTPPDNEPDSGNESNDKSVGQVHSLGSGFIVDPAGYIVTNNHVIEQADKIIVKFSDGNSVPAEIVGKDLLTDLALLKVDLEDDLPFVRFGDSGKARVGDWVVAIGNPFGLGGSVTAGIISARNRNINAGPYDDFIQTDAAINRGNSGGPLFNLSGEVIGVNTVIISTTGGAMGIGFSIPSLIVSNIVDQLREFGETRRGWLGVRIRMVTDDLAEGLGLPEKKGALVENVDQDGPAERAGIKAGDVILSFDGKPIQTMSILPRIVAETPVKKKLEVVVWRREKEKVLKVELGLLDSKRLESVVQGTPNDDDAFLSGQDDILGMRFGRSTPEMDGVAVLQVEDGSLAAEKEIRVGDVILEVDQQHVKDVRDIQRHIENLKKKGRQSALFRVKRDNDVRFVAIRLPE